MTFSTRKIKAMAAVFKVGRRIGKNRLQNAYDLVALELLEVVLVFCNAYGRVNRIHGTELTSGKLVDTENCMT